MERTVLTDISAVVMKVGYGGRDDSTEQESSWRKREKRDQQDLGSQDGLGVVTVRSLPIMQGYFPLLAIMIAKS